MAHVFISYMRENAAFVERLRRELDDAGISVWFDRGPQAIKPGSAWAETIEDEIRACTYFLPCFSTEYVERGDDSYFQREIELAINVASERVDDQGFLVPVVVSEGVGVPSLDIGGGRTLDGLQWIDLTPTSWDEGLNDLLDLALSRPPPDAVLHVARQLARDARATLHEDSQLAALLAAESVLSSERRAIEASPVAVDALAAVVSESRARPVPHISGHPRHTGFSADGHWLSSAAGITLTLSRLDERGFETRRVDIALDVDDDVEVVGPVDDRWVATGQQGSTTLWDISSDRPRPASRAAVDIVGVCETAAGPRLLTLRGDRQLSALALGGARHRLPGRRIADHYGRASDVAISPTGSWCAFFDKASIPRLCHFTDSGSHELQTLDSRSMRMMRFSKNGRWLAVSDTDRNHGHTGAHISMWRLNRDAWSTADDKRDFVPGRAIDIVEVSPRGTWLAVVGWRVGDMGDNDRRRPTLAPRRRRVRADAEPQRGGELGRVQ